MGIDFFIDTFRSSCWIAGHQSETDATLNGWKRNYANNTFSCSYVLKFEPMYYPSEGFMTVELLRPDGSIVSSLLIPYSARQGYNL